MLKLAVQNLLSRPMRSLLALLGLTVAIVGMVGLFSVAGGINYMVSDTFGRIPGLVAMQPGAPIPLFSNVPSEWADEIEQVPGVAVVNREIWSRANVIDGKMIFSPPRFLFGTDIETRLQLKHGVYAEELIAGRFLTLDDRGTYNTVVSKQIAEEFGKWVGDSLEVNGYELTIVGIYHCGSLLLDVAIILDIDQVRTITRFDPGSVSGFYIEQTGEVEDEVLIERINQVFAGRSLKPWSPSGGLTPAPQLGSGGNPIAEFFKSLDRQLKSQDNANPPEDAPASQGRQPLEIAPPDTESNPQSEIDASEHRFVNGATQKPDATTAKPSNPPAPTEIRPDLPLEVRSATDWAQRFDKFSEDLNLFLVIMTGIGVTIAVLSIINTMLMSVSERIIEFGILRANGWSKTDIMKLITFESAALGVAGGLLGCTFGWIGTQVANWYWPTRVHLVATPELLLFSIVFSTCLGIAGGLYPAIWATRLSPMDAIRRS
jgi:putative ABC transport system permease protein